MLRKLLLIGALCTVTAITVNPAQADVTGLFNTGAATSSTLYGDQVQDFHYSTAYVADVGSSVSDYGTLSGAIAAQAFALRTTAGGNSYTLADGTYPIPPYFTNASSPGSKWITDEGGHGHPPSSLNPGFFVFHTSFSVSGTGQSIMGKWSSDNEGVDILLNGVSISPTMTANNQFQLGFSNFPTVGGLTQGTNYLDFVVYNSALGGTNPVGLRVEMTAIPEPAFYQMSGLLLGGGAMVLRLRKRKKSA